MGSRSGSKAPGDGNSRTRVITAQLEISIPESIEIRLEGLSLRSPATLRARVSIQPNIGPRGSERV